MNLLLRKNIIRLPSLLFSLLWVSSVFAQDTLQGKTFELQLSASCAKTTDGGCMKYTYQVFTFGKDSVEIYKDFRVSCFPKKQEENYTNLPGYERTSYAFKQNGKEIIILDYTEYICTIEQGRFIGVIENNYHVFALKREVQEK